MISKAGVGDPYFYEWSIGLEKTISLITPDCNLKSVTIQSFDSYSLDDVVCEYDNYFEFIQVKHTRENNPFGFSSLISGEKTLLSKIAISWKKLNEIHENGKAILLTNRILTKNPTKIRNVEVQSFESFWNSFVLVCESSESLEEIKNNIPESHKEALNLVLEELICLDNENQIFEFLKNFSIQYNYKENKEIDSNIVLSLMSLFGIDEMKANNLYEKLFFALKKWASSTRLNPKITAEDVYERLSVSEISYPTIQLLPPEPFFESRKKIVKDIESYCEYGNKRMIFLYGNPGIGKTSLVNYISQKTDSIIDLRYYTYIPIIPENNSVNIDFDNSVTSEKLWGSLLNQLRLLFKGKLFENDVPINNSFLSENEMIQHVLRLSSIFAKIQGKKTIIAIDGIDHAARSGNELNFLSTLVKPEQIPEDVVIIICGQPSNNYQEYPVWLSEENNLIKTVELDGITEEDILYLLDNKDSLFDDKEIIAKEILKFSNGNTLTAIFAVYETKNAKDLQEFLTLLSQKKLNSNLLEYYDHVWNSRTNQEQLLKIEDELLLSSLFLIVKEKIHITEFNEIFPNINLSLVGWELLLEQYSPLISCENQFYFLYHNDIRVYLENKIRARKPALKYTATLLLDYYMKNEIKVSMKHKDAFRLLDISEQPDRKIEVFNLGFLKEAFEIGESVEDIINQFQEVCSEFEKNFDDKYLTNLSMLSIVLNQYVKVHERYEIEEKFNFENYFSSEYEKINLNIVTFSSINSTLEEIVCLFNSGELERANRTFKKWFSNTKNILQHAQNNTDKKLRQQISVLGEIFYKLSYLSVVLEIKINLNTNTKNHFLDNSYFNGKIDGLLKINNVEEFLNYAMNVKSLVYIDNLLIKVYKDRQIDWIKKFFQINLENYDEQVSLESGISYCFFKSIINENYSFKKINNVLHDQKTIAFFKERENVSPLLCGQLAFLSGRENLDKWKTINKISSLFFSVNRDDRAAESFNIMLKNFYELGKAKIDTFNFNSFENHFFEINSQKNMFLITGTFESKCFIEWYGVYLINSNTNIDDKRKMTSFFLDITKNKKIYSDWFTKILWNYLDSRGYENELKEYYENWFDSEGYAWDLTISEMQSQYDLLTELVKDLDNTKKMIENSNIRYRKRILGFVEHKEDILEYPFQVLKQILSTDSSNWKNRGLNLYKLSNIVSLKGDNLLYDSILKSLLEASVETGPEDFMSLLNCKFFDEQIIENNFFIKQILKNKLHTESDKISFWSLLEATSISTSLSDKQEIIDYLKSLKIKDSDQIYVDTRICELESLINFSDKKLVSRVEELSKEKDNKENTIEMNITYLKSKDAKKSTSNFEDIFNESLDLLENKVHNYKKFRNELYSIFVKRIEGYSWSYQNFELIISKLFKVITQDQKENLFLTILSNNHFEKNSRYWLSSFTSDLNIYTINYLENLNFDLLLSYFDVLINEINSWVNHKSESNTQFNLIKKNGEVFEWIDCIEKLLLKLFSTNDILDTSGCIKGLYYFYLVMPERWNTENVLNKYLFRQQYLLLLALEELARNNIDIGFSSDFLLFCKEESKMISLSLQARITLFVWKGTPSFLYEEFGKHNFTIQRKRIHNQVKQIDNLSHSLKLKFQRSFNEYCEINSEDVGDTIVEIKTKGEGRWKFSTDNTEDVLIEKYLYSELITMGYRVFELIDILIIDDPLLLFSDSLVLEYDEKYFNRNVDNKTLITHIEKSINNIIGNDRQIIGIAWKKMNETGPELLVNSFALSPAEYEFESNNLEVGKIIGRTGNYVPISILEKNEYNIDMSLFNIVYGTTIFFKTPNLLPSSFLKRILLESDLNLQRSLFVIPNNDYYIDRFQNLNLSIEVWHIMNNEIEKVLQQYKLKLNNIIEE